MDDAIPRVDAYGVISVCDLVAYSVNSITLLVSGWHLAVWQSVNGGAISVDIGETLVRSAILCTSCADS